MGGIVVQVDESLKIMYGNAERILENFDIKAAD